MIVYRRLWLNSKLIRPLMSALAFVVASALASVAAASPPDGSESTEAATESTEAATESAEAATESTEAATESTEAVVADVALDDARSVDAVDAVEASPSPSPRPPGESRMRLSFDLGAGAALDVGTVPDVTAGLFVQANSVFGRVQLTVTGTWLASTTEQFESGSSWRAGWLGVGLDGCYLSGDIVRMGPCLGAELGQLSVIRTRAPVTNGVVDEPRVESNHTAVFAQGGWTLHGELTPSLYLALWAAVRTPLSYPRLRLNGIDETFRASPVGIRISLALTFVLG